MKVKLRKEMFISMLILLPYLENNFTQKYIQWYFDKSYIRSITIISFFVIGIVFLITLTKKEQKVINKYIKMMMITLSVYSAIMIVLTSNLMISICSWIWLATPMIYALIACRYCNVSKSNLTLVLKYSIVWFTLYLSVVVVYYIFVHHLFLDQTVRMNPRGGGAVIFGYTIALFFILAVIYKNEFKIVPYYLILVILTIGSLGTASRGSVWLVVLFWIANFIFKKLNRNRIIIFIFLVPIFVYLCTLDFSSLETTTFTGFARLFNIHSFRRMTSTTNVLDVFGEMPFIRKIFGMGPGGFFPYQEWTMSIDDVENNMFNYMGYSILVQPHNSFLYILMEYGLIGFANLVLIFIGGIKRVFSDKSPRWIYKLIFVGSIIVLNCLDSVFFVQPGTAFTFWFLLLLVLDDDWVHSNRCIFGG